MAEFKLDRFKYNWRGNWAAGTEYTRDDVVRVNGRSYVCIESHIADTYFQTDLNAVIPQSDPPQPKPKWIVMTASNSFLGDWSTGTAYNLGDIVFFGGTLWECTNDHISAAFEDNDDKWNVFARHINFIGDWASGTQYAYGALVKYNGIVYKAVYAHTAQTTLEENLEDWTVFNDGIQFRGDYEEGQTYRLNDLVRYGGSVFQCLETHVAPTLMDDTRFSVRFKGNQFSGEWADDVAYNEGDIVRYGGYLYYADKNSFDFNPTNDDSSEVWTLIAPEYNFRGDWVADREYRTGDVVQRGGQVLVAKTDVNISDGDDSTVAYLDTTMWEVLIPGEKHKGDWSGTAYYSKGDIVYYRGSAYVCSDEHQSMMNTYPGDNGSGYDYWDMFVQAGIEGGLQYTGDLLTYGKSRAAAGDDSTLGDTRVPIGEEGQFLSTSEDLEVYWRSLTNDFDVVYVDERGQDEEGYGLSPDFPFRTVRHACEYIEDNLAPLTPAKVSVATGTFEEIGPISIPAGCVVMGDELRATVISATRPIPEYQGDISFVRDYVLRMRTQLEDLVLNVAWDNAEGTTKTQNLSYNAADANAVVLINNLLDDYQNFIEFRVDDGDIDPDKSGSNNETTSETQLNASKILNANKEYLADEISQYMLNTYPDDGLTKMRIKSDVRALIRGMARDLKYSGNYATLYAARRYANATNGSRLDDIFYVRDTTGVRQCTIEGLQGDLNPPGVYDLYQRPTGGACVSLDPGWGPDDERMWIVNRSPYIQGVTNIGSRCVGKKVDGSLHNGGNKSMTSNDFTQVLSDGIGAWLTNGGRAELVSVFTYYCQVGYLCENGGIARATNGNNSYGSFGSVADGNDPTETPTQCTLNNRENEAQVAQALAGGANDQLFVFEFTHAGENYTSADATIIGAGDDADVEFTDFRDGALSEGRLVNTKGSGAEGGSGYLIRQYSAQVTVDSTSTIRLSANDPTQFLNEIEGMRILIVAGDGSGQYGYISDFDFSTKDVTVRRESDDELGWDHVVPGYPIETSLDSSALYRIEPRVAVAPPPYTAAGDNLNAARTFVDATYGGTRAQYFGLVGQLGSGETFDADPVASTWNVERADRTYEVNIATAGAGYAVGDTIILAGDDLGGEVGTNDITIEITEVSDDSTNSIEAFTFEGTPRGRRWVAISNPNVVDYSDDANNFLTSALPYSSNYVTVLSGEDRFLAVSTPDNKVAFSYDAETWIQRSLPTYQDWSDGAFGNGRFVIVSGTADTAVYSSDGLTWSLASIPVNTAGDSSTIKWDKVAYGAGKFVAISSNFQDVAYSTNGAAWSRVEGAIPDGPLNWDIVAFEFGNGRFMALSSNGQVAYSFNGINWYIGTRAPFPVHDPGSVLYNYSGLKYCQGVFAATYTKFVTLTDSFDTVEGMVTTEDGVLWTDRVLGNSGVFGKGIACGSYNDKPTWLFLADELTTGGLQRANIGSRAKLRADILNGAFQTVKIWDPGSNYALDGSDFTVTVTDTQYTADAEIDPRMRNKVLAQPSFVNAGVGYRSTSSTITITGDGFADIIPEANEIVLDGVQIIPGPGVQIRISTVPDENTEDPDDLRLFTGVSATDLGEDDSGNGTRTVRFTVTPRVRNEYNLEHGTGVALNILYSQARITGHDFLDIGTGNFEETNYPEIYASGNYFVAAPENEVQEINGGRVFYVSTDQDGNFRAGELFGVDQATGIVTISAEFFDLDGLSELALGGVRLGGSGAVVREFSTDPTFSADSNNIVPTQRAIASFLANRLSVGGENLETNEIVAGKVKIGGEENVIDMTTSDPLNFNRTVDFSGADDGGRVTAIQGTIVGQMLFLRQGD